MKLFNFTFKTLSIILISFCISCSDSDNSDDMNNGDDNSEILDENFETNSQDIDVENAISLSFDEDGVTIFNPFENVHITDENGSVIITSVEENTEINYVLSGQTKTGSVKIYSNYKFGLILNGVSIISNNGPAINIQSSKKASVTLVENTNNRLIDSSTYPTDEEEDMKAAFFSEGQLVFEGNGTLYVLGRYKHAICSDDYINIKSGNIKVSGSVTDGINVNDYFKMSGGTLNITSGNDGIDCGKGYIEVGGGTISINAKEGDGIKTSYKGSDTSISPYIKITGGNVDVTCTGNAAKGIKSKGDVTLSGGKINITTSGDAYYDTDDADITSSSCIKCDGNMIISGESTTVTTTSSGSAGKGINVEGTLTFDGGTTTVTTSGDIFKYGNDDSAAKAIKSTGNLTVNSGNITIKTTKEEAEGLESKATLTINGGTIEIEAYDDCINASNHIEITGGNIYCNSTVNDAIDSNGTLTITGGTIIAAGATAPEAGIDCDNSTFKITGGTIIGIGGSTSTPTSNVSTQRSVVYSNNNSYNIIHIETAEGSELVTFKLPKSYNQNTTFLFSSPNMKANTNYAIYTGGSITGGSDFHGLYTGSTYTKGAAAATFTSNSIVTTIGNNGGGHRP